MILATHSPGGARSKSRRWAWEAGGAAGTDAPMRSKNEWYRRLPERAGYNGAAGSRRDGGVPPGQFRAQLRGDAR
jgi:hypothetical protein